MDVRSSGEVKVELPKVLCYLDSVNKIIAKVDTINSLSLFSTIINYFPLETPGIEEAAQSIIDLFFPHSQHQEDGVAYIFSNKNFVSLKQDVASLNQVFKECNSTDLQSSELNHDSDVVYNAVVDEDGNTMYQLVSNAPSDRKDVDLLKSISLGTEGPELPLTFKSDLPTCDKVLENQDSDVNSDEVNQPSEISREVLSLNKEPNETLHEDPRQHLKELIAWILEEACKENIPTNFDPLRGQYPSYYGLSSKLGKHECF